MYLVFYLFSTASFLLQQAVTQNTGCCPPPVSLFALSSDLNDGLFPGLTTDFYLVTAGEVDSILQLPGVSSRLALRTDIVDFPLVWVSNEAGVYFNMTITSSNTDILPTPVALPISFGNVPTDPLRVHIIYECASESTEITEVRIDIYTYMEDTGEEFCPLFFKFGKYCEMETSLSSGLRMDYQEFDYIQEMVTIPPYVGCNGSNMTMENSPSNNILRNVLASVLTIVFVLILVAGMGIGMWTIWYCRLKRHSEELELVAVGKAFQDTHGSWTPLREAHEKEFPADRLTKKRELGEGAFGIVYEGLADGIEIEGESSHVAVKQLRDTDAIDEFFREVEFMSRLDHPQIVRLLGVCSLQEPFTMIFEYMDLGDLCSFLREAALLQAEGEDEGLLEPLQMLDICLQVARGMVYISQKRFVHRDLAARNCLVTTGLVVKIADFGMSRNIYSTDYYRVQGSALLPVRWMAPESVRYGKFSEASDVWSFGVLLWEVFTLGEQPFTGYTNDEVIELLGKRTHLDPPKNCPVKQAMLDCWEWRSKDRPKFSELCSHISTVIHDMENDVRVGLEARSTDSNV